MLHRKIITIVLLLITGVVWGSPKPTQVTSLSIATFKNDTRLILSLDKTFKYRQFTLTKPDRLIVDLENTVLKTNIKRVNLHQTDVKNIRSGRHQNTLRLVFDLKRTLFAKAYIQKPHGYLPYRLIVDLSSRSDTFKNASTAKSVVATRSVPLKKPPKQPKKIYVVIDPGHGGKDPGAIGLRGTKEKNVVLAVAKDLYHLLRQQKNIVPLLTRSGDYFVTLRGRLKLARQHDVYLFISIHADAYKNHYARGASVFTLSEHGATSEAGRWLSNSENNAVLMGGVDLQDKSYLLRSVLLDLSQTATLRNSLQLGHDVLRSLAKFSRLHTARVEQAPFVVLKSPDIPTILVETGFISNRDEERLLRDPHYQHKIASALTQGIMHYLKTSHLC